MTEREIVVRAIEAYLTADKIAHRKPKAEQILVAIERLGYVSPEAIMEQERKWVESEKTLNREAAFEERRLYDEVEYWKGKNYRLGQ